MDLIKTSRLTLRPVAASDEAAVVAALNHLDVTGWLSLVPHPYAASDFHHFLTQIAKAGDTFMVDDDQGPTGVVGVEGGKLGIESAELGYWFAPQSHGKGYATEAARAVLAAKFAEDSTDIVSGHFEGNSRSANVLRKLGFVETGRWLRVCRVWGQDRPHVDMRLTRAAFVAALPIEARSNRLAYRALQATDLDKLHELVSHWDVVRQLASFPWPPERDFTRTRAQPYTGRGFVWGVFLDGRLIGTVGVTGEELGYMFAPDVWGQGFAFEACGLAVAQAFAQGRDHLEAGIWADNAASLGVLRKMGFNVVADDLAFNKARGAEMAGHVLTLTRADWERSRDVQ